MDPDDRPEFTLGHLADFVDVMGPRILAFCKQFAGRFPDFYSWVLAIAVIPADHSKIEGMQFNRCAGLKQVMFAPGATVRKIHWFNECSSLSSVGL
jgi:hypothetical protein